MNSLICAGLLFFGFVSGGIPSGTVEVGELTCETLMNPLAIDRSNPRLSWMIQSSLRGEKQTAYQILVATSRELLERDEGDCWDTGKVLSDQSIQVPYAGAPLASFQNCFWKVRVWDKSDTPSAWSEPAWWTMGVLKEADWAGAQWIGMPLQNEDSSLQKLFKTAHWIWVDEKEMGLGVACFSKEFTCSVSIASATCWLAADNIAKLYVNGQWVGDWNRFDHACSYDIAPYLRVGENQIGFAVENLGEGPNPAGLLAMVHGVDQEGKRFSIVTDDSWQGSREPVVDWKMIDGVPDSWGKAKEVGRYGAKPWKKVKFPEERVLSARMLRREFKVEGVVRRASVYFSGLGLSELYLNGEKLGDAVLSPGCTEYDKKVFYVSYEVGDRLINGENALGIWLGNGRYYAPRLNEPTKTRTYGYPKAIALLRLEMADGSVRTVVTDTQWKGTTKGPIRANNEYDGEIYDARMEMPGWAKAGFADSAWKDIEQVEAPGGALVAERINPIRVIETLKPVGITQPRPGVYVYDMGQNMVGWCRLHVQGPRGTNVKMRFAETVLEDGSIYLANIRGAKVTDVYTLKGEGVEVYEPRFTYHGFRYVELSGFPGEPTLDTLTGCVVHDALPRSGSFTCSNKLLNQIYQNVYWGTRGNYRSMPTDCPQRDERQGWLGDRSEESRGEAYLFDIAALYSKWVGDMDDAQKENGSVPDVCPSYWPLYNDNVTWPSSFVIIPNMLYSQYADLDTIAMHYDGMKQWIVYMLHYKKDGIMPRDSYGDWCVPPEQQELIHSKDPARKTPGDFLGTAYFCHDLRLMAQYAQLLGRAEDAAEFSQWADEMTEAFTTKFFNADEVKYVNGTQTSCVLPLAFGLVPEQYREKLFARLVDKIERETQGHIGTGLIGGQQLMRVLSDNGRADLAYAMATKTAYPSWGYMIEHDATTIWELWNGNTADPAMNSHNHVMLVGDLNLWFHEYLAGIRPAQPGFKEIRMQPYPVGDLSYARATRRSLYGTIFSDWRIEADAFHWRVTLPANTTAKLYIPAVSVDAITEGGQPVADVDALRFVGMEKNWAVFEADAGQYQFISKEFVRPGQGGLQK